MNGPLSIRFKKDNLILKMVRKEVLHDKDIDCYFFECPHCDQLIQVFRSEINCSIFRHALTKDYSQINPHLPKDLCDKLVLEGTIFGCAKPFRFFNGNPPYVEDCDYI